jgi:UPF0755 protein
MTRRPNPFDERENQSSGLAWLVRVAVLALAVTACFTAGLVLLNRWQAARLSSVITVEGGDPRLNPIDRLYLQSQLALGADELSEPAGSGNEPVRFEVAPGQSANEIAANLQASGLLANTELFIHYLRYYGLDSRLEAGIFEIDPQFTIPQMATTLTRAHLQDITLNFLEGWRAEEMTHYLAVTQPANIDADEFLALVQRRSSLDLSEHDFLASLPFGASLEGFLFPDAYQLPVDADAQYLVNLMLDNFAEQVTPAMRQSFGAHGLSVHDAVILASIVQREAIVPEEKPIMVGVFLNRLARLMPLQADPTVQYALGWQPETQTWWKVPLDVADLEVESSYNTYAVGGLPPGPISNPGLASLQAAANPVESEYLFFVLDCRAELTGVHIFSNTYEEHVANVEYCR